MANVASKQQTTALFLSTIVTQTRRHTELRRKLTNLMGKLCCARKHSPQFFVHLFTELNCAVNLEGVGPFRRKYVHISLGELVSKRRLMLAIPFKFWSTRCSFVAVT